MYSKDNLSKLPRMGELSPEAMTAFWAYDKVAQAKDRTAALVRRFVINHHPVATTAGSDFVDPQC